MNITVYAASSGQVPDKYIDMARQLGTVMAQAGHTLINGAGRTGLMGATADAVLSAGGKAIGVIPQFMIDQGWQHPGMAQLVVTKDMHERKEIMAERSDACIALPGGVGTLEELLEVITWKQLGIYLKPIVILNVDGYYDALLAQLEKLLTNILCVASTAASGKSPPPPKRPFAWRRPRPSGTPPCGNSPPSDARRPMCCQRTWQCLPIRVFKIQKNLHDF